MSGNAAELVDVLEVASQIFTATLDKLPLKVSGTKLFARQFGWSGHARNRDIVAAGTGDWNAHHNGDA